MKLKLFHYLILTGAFMIAISQIPDYTKPIGVIKIFITGFVYIITIYLHTNKK